MSKLMTDGAIIERQRKEIVILTYALERIANANSQATLTSRECEAIARTALGMEPAHFMPVDY